MLKEKVQKALNDQINAELYSAYLYLGISTYFEEANLNGNWLVLRFNFDNPGGLDIDIATGNLTLSQTYNIPNTMLPNGIAQSYPITTLPAGENTSAVIWIPISEPDIGTILANGEADLYLDLELWVPERCMKTHIFFEGTVEVSA